MANKHPILMATNWRTKQMGECHAMAVGLTDLGFSFHLPDAGVVHHYRSFVRYVMCHPVMWEPPTSHWCNYGLDNDRERSLIAARKILVLVGSMSAELQQVCRSQNERTMREYRDIIDAAKALQVCP